MVRLGLWYSLRCLKLVIRGRIHTARKYTWEEAILPRIGGMTTYKHRRGYNLLLLLLLLPLLRADVVIVECAGLVEGSSRGLDD